MPKGRLHNRWKGGRTKRRGYVLIYKPNHPRANGQGYVMEQVLVMEKHLGRYLTKTEIVHHTNRIRDDNNIKNLQLYKNEGKHRAIHNKEDKTVNLPFITKQWLEEQYKSKSIAQISKEIGMSRDWVWNKLKQYNIKRRK